MTEAKMCHRLMFLAKVPSLRSVLSNIENVNMCWKIFHKCVLKMFFSSTAFDDIINELSRVAGVYDMYHHALQSQHVFNINLF